MIFSEILRLVWVNILENKFKVLLTSLGIIVGAATIVMVIAIGKGGQQDVADQFKNLSAGAIEISTTSASSSSSRGGFGGPPGSFGGGGGSRSGSGGGMTMMMMGGPGGFGGGFGLESTLNVTFTETDIEELALFVPGIAQISLSASGKYDVLGGNLEEAASSTVAGVLPNYKDVSNLSMLVGEFFTEDDNTNKNKVCVLGYSLAMDMFDSPIDAYDSVINIDGRSYTVVGVIAEMGSMMSGISPDESVYLPYNTSTKYIFGTTANPQITAVAADVSNVPTMKENLTTVLNATYPGASFTITDAGSKMEAASQSANTLSMLLIAVASIVFVVGGIGIMNVLFVTVKERTREIGVLKALGCSKRDILMEFIVEANCISTFGGLAGVALGFALMPLLGKFMTVLPTGASAVLALLFAILTGTVFGFYPAFKASNLVPIEALNQE